MAIPESRRLDFDEIPALDLGGLDDVRRREATIEAIDRACTDVGFFYGVDHGFDMRLTARLLQAARAFFDQPEESKLGLGLDPSMRGYLPLYYHSKISDAFSGTCHQEGLWPRTRRR